MEEEFYNYMMENGCRRKKQFNKIDHEELGKDIIEISKILSPYVEKLWQAYGVRSKEAKALHQALYLLTCHLSSLMDDQWYRLEETKVDVHRSPYYGEGKISWLK